MEKRIVNFFIVFAIVFVFTFSLIAGGREDSKEYDNLDNLSEKVDEYVNALNKLNSNPSVSGTILIADEQEIIFNKSYGKANIENGTEFNSNTKFRLASVSKVITAIATMQLVEKQILSLDDKVSEYIPEF